MNLFKGRSENNARFHSEVFEKTGMLIAMESGSGNEDPGQGGNHASDEQFPRVLEYGPAAAGMTEWMVRLSRAITPRARRALRSRFNSYVRIIPLASCISRRFGHILVYDS
jgi:hypothetical protein